MPRIHQVEIVTLKGTLIKIGLFLIIVLLLFLLYKCAIG